MGGLGEDPWSMADWTLKIIDLQKYKMWLDHWERNFENPPPWRKNGPWLSYCVSQTFLLQWCLWFIVSDRHTNIFFNFVSMTLATVVYAVTFTEPLMFHFKIHESSRYYSNILKSCIILIWLQQFWWWFPKSEQIQLTVKDLKLPCQLVFAMASHFDPKTEIEIQWPFAYNNFCLEFVCVWKVMVPQSTCSKLSWHTTQFVTVL